MTEIAATIEWSDLLETYFAQTGERCHGLSWCHKRSEARYSRLRNFTDLPVVILGVVNGSVSIGSSSLFGDSPFASICVGIIALFTAILSTIAAYFKWAQRAEAHRISALHYAKLHRFLSIQMGLPRDERMSPSDLLRSLKDAFDRLAEISPMIPTEVIAEFKTKFDKPEYKAIARPSECNGLEAIHVYTSPSLQLSVVSPPAAHIPRVVSSASHFSNEEQNATHPQTASAESARPTLE
jgi:hypothetical protein